MTIAGLKPGQSGIISQVSGAGELRLRLLDMGLVPGTGVRLEAAAPLGDPIRIRVRGYALTLRRADGEKIVLREKGL